MNYTHYITRDPQVMMGKPVIKGTRITVELIIRKLAGGFTVDDLLICYPHISKDKIYAAFEFAADVIANEEVIEMA